MLNRVYKAAIYRNQTFLYNAIRLTSAGPPPGQPPVPGSLSDRYDKFIGRWPKVQAVHRMVVDGSRWCFSDIKTYFKVRKALSSGKKLNELTISELEVLVQSGGELIKMLSLMIILQIPGPGDILILLLIFFPRYVLTRHFWTNQQRKEFFLKEVERSMANTTSYEKVLLESPSSGSSPIENATYNTIMALARLHGYLPIPFNLQKRLENRATGLKALDSILISHLDSLTSQQLYFHMYIRRLTYEQLSDEEIKEKLRKWLSTTSNLTGQNYLLAPYFLNRQC